MEFKWMPDTFFFAWKELQSEKFLGSIAKDATEAKNAKNAKENMGRSASFARFAILP